MKKFVVPVLTGLLVAVLPMSAAVVDAAPRVVTPPVGASAYSPISPSRLADTRTEFGASGFTRVGPNTIRVQVTGRFGIAAGATAAVLNVASVNAFGIGFVTAFPAGSPLPTASSLNVDAAGRTIANLTTVRLSAGGAVDLFMNVAMDLVVDVAGTYSAVTTEVSAGRLVTISGGARRALDTRSIGITIGPGGTQVVDLASVGVPADAVAVAVNLAAVNANPGFWTAYPSGDPLPLASNLNIDEFGQTRNSQAIVRLNAGPRTFNVYSFGGGQLVVDVVGWFTGASSPASTDGLFVPNTPTRRLDTRDSFALPPWGDSTIEFSPGSTLNVPIAAVAMNLAITQPWYVGFVTAFPAGQPRPLSANLNITAFDQIISNHAIVRVGARGVALYTQNGTHMIVDVAGWYLGQPDASTAAQLPIPAYGPTYAVSIDAPNAGLSVPVRYGRNITSIVDQGVAGLWGGYGTLGTADHNVYTAHRTSKGAPFRNIDRMPVGSTFTVTGADGVDYLYLVQRVDVISPVPAVLVDIATRTAPITVTLVACHPPHSVKYRIAVTGRLIGATP